MTSNVHYLHGRPRQIAQYTRVGYSEHRLIEQLLSAGKLPVNRFVIEAANYDRQSGLIRHLRDENAEITLDTNVAELSTKGKFSGGVRAAPWAVDQRPLEAEDFKAGTNRSVIEPIAHFAVDKKVSTVMAPTHYLGDEQMAWFDIDLRTCVALRENLDRMGGQDIAIDYPLIITYAQFRDPIFRQLLIDGLRNIPFDNLWLRISGFGADATASGVERYIKGLFAFHVLERPIIADHLGGLASLAICAFGASSGFAHGITGKERFSATGWVNPKGHKGGGGGGKKVYIHGLDRRILVEDARKMFDDARTSRDIFGCSDKTCCGDIDRMLSNPEAHFMVQKGRQVNDLSQVPESIRADQFITDYVEQARRQSGRAMKLKKTDDDAKKKINKAQKHLAKLEDNLINLNEQLGSVEFAKETQMRPVRRGKGSLGVKG